MSGLAVFLVLVAAVLHASWNLIAKRSDGGPVFVWLFALVSVTVYGPIGLLILYSGGAIRAMGAVELLFLFGSGAIHLAYFLTLQRGYRIGDLSLIYPLSRGTGPILATLGAILLFAERPSGLALMGALLVPFSIFLLAGRAMTKDRRRDGRAAAYGIGTGLLIATYTLWDKHAVAGLLIHPIVLDLGSNVTRVLLFAPYALRRRESVREEWRKNRKAAILVGILSPLAYVLILTAMTFTPASYVAPAREVSILIGTLMGTHVLAEAGDQRRRRLIGACGMTAAVLALALG